MRSLLCEGGPHTHGQLVELELIDELFVTIAPKLAGGSGPGLLEGVLEQGARSSRVAAREDARALLALPRGAADGRGLGRRDQALLLDALLAAAQHSQREDRRRRAIAARPKLTWTLSTPSRVQ